MPFDRPLAGTLRLERAYRRRSQQGRTQPDTDRAVHINKTTSANVDHAHTTPPILLLHRLSSIGTLAAITATCRPSPHTHVATTR